MSEITDYQMEQLATFIGDFGFVAIFVGYVAWFIYRGFFKP